MAGQMRDLIRERLQAGDRPEQVMSYFVQRYGDWVLLAPPARGLNLLLWLAPFGAVVGGLVLVLTLAHRWRRRSPPPEPAPASAIGPRDRQRLAAELERLDD
jgi:cytochrome c-type biogenesis protein CcmH